jgi:hypothetical protein
MPEKYRINTFGFKGKQPGTINFNLAATKN